MVMDVRTSFDDFPNPPYIPENVDRKWRGPVLLRYALANSMNIPAVKVTQFVGVPAVLDTAHKMGITTLTQEGYYGLSLTLGGGEVKLLDRCTPTAPSTTSACSTVRPCRRRTSGPATARSTRSRFCASMTPRTRPSTSTTRPTSVRVLQPEHAYLITDILSDNAARMLNSGLIARSSSTGPAAAKTGTTNDWKDNWTIGYTPDLVTGVWVGNANNEEMRRSFGSTAAAPIWHDFMIEVAQEHAAEQIHRAARHRPMPRSALCRA